VLARFLRQAKYRLAMLAFAVNMRLAVAEFVLLQLEKAREPIPNFQKGAVFLLSAVNIAGEEAEEIERDYEQLYDPKDPALEKEPDDQKCTIDPKDRPVEAVVSVSPVHKANDLIRKFAFLHEMFLSCEISATV
jgi:hypothetical protein